MNQHKLSCLSVLVLFSSLTASASEATSVECKYDHRPHDGNALVMTVAANRDGSHDFSIELTPAGRGGGQKFAAAIQGMECVFSDKVTGVYSCVLSGDRFEEQQQVSVSYEVHPFMGEMLTATLRYLEATKTGSKLAEKTFDFMLKDCSMTPAI